VRDIPGLADEESLKEVVGSMDKQLIDGLK